MFGYERMGLFPNIMKNGNISAEISKIHLA